MADTLPFLTVFGCLVQDRLLQDAPGHVFGKSQALQIARRLQQVQDYVCAAALDRFDASGVFQPASALAELSGTISARTSHKVSDGISTIGSHKRTRQLSDVEH